MEFDREETFFKNVLKEYNTQVMYKIHTKYACRSSWSKELTVSVAFVTRKLSNSHISL